MDLSGKFVYITGDSFCAYRSDINLHWPARLADLLKLELRGNGYPGQGWWPSRVDLGNYLQTQDFHQTELFIFCHTDIYRPLSAFRSDVQDRLELYNKYFLDEMFHEWAAERWYAEINKTLENRHVVHLHCFESNRKQKSILKGLHVEPELLNLSKFNYVNEGRKIILRSDRQNNHACNHFTPMGNHILAEAIFACIESGQGVIDRDEFLRQSYK